MVVGDAELAKSDMSGCPFCQGNVCLYNKSADLEQKVDNLSKVCWIDHKMIWQWFHAKELLHFLNFVYKTIIKKRGKAYFQIESSVVRLLPDQIKNGLIKLRHIVNRPPRANRSIDKFYLLL